MTLVYSLALTGFVAFVALQCSSGNAYSQNYSINMFRNDGAFCQKAFKSGLGRRSKDGYCRTRNGGPWKIGPLPSRR